jgi:putative endonuclease
LGVGFREPQKGGKEHCNPVRSSFVYILSSLNRAIYIGVTSNIERRVYEHKMKLVPGFTQRYNVTRLVYPEEFADIRDAITREKQLKGWLRSRKVALIQEKNPKWDDLAANWFKSANKVNK